MAFSGRKPFVPVLIFTLFVVALLFLILTLLGISWNPVYLFPVGFFGVLTLAIQLWQEPAFNSDMKGSLRRFMLGLTLKMLISLVVVVLMLFTIHEEFKVNTVIIFAACYLAYLAFGTVRLLNLSTHGR